MYYYDSNLSESLKTSPKTSTDTASNWSRPVKKETKAKYKIGSLPRRTTRLLTKKINSKKNRIEEARSNAKGPHLGLRRYSLKLRRLPCQFNIKQTKRFIERISDQSRVVCFLWHKCQQQTLELEAKVACLQQRLRELQVEEVEIKRKRWCRVCEKEATYVQAKRFYCSPECERKYDQLQQQ